MKREDIDKVHPETNIPSVEYHGHISVAINKRIQYAFENCLCEVNTKYCSSLNTIAWKTLKDIIFLIPEPFITRPHFHPPFLCLCVRSAIYPAIQKGMWFQFA